MKTNPDYGQHFLFDQTILKTIIGAANLTKEDTVLEIGPGTGNLTHLLMPLVKKVITVEIDERFKEHLRDVDVIWGDALDYVRKNRGFNKIVANIPYHLGEPLLQELCLKNLELAVLLVPKMFAQKMASHPIYSAFFTFSIITDVSREVFNPVPKVDSVVLKLAMRRDDDKKSILIRYLFRRRNQKLKNALQELCIDSYLANSKKEAKLLYEKLFDQFLLNLNVKELKPKQYEEIVGKIVKK